MIYNSHKRCTLPEWMDDPNIEPEILAAAVSDIHKVDRLLGGLRFTIKAINQLIKTIDGKVHIVDFGCSDGLLIRELAKIFKGDRFEFTGIDLSMQSIHNARKLTDDCRIKYVAQDITTVQPNDLQADIITCNLTLHHFNDEQIIELLKKFYELTRYAIVINDLHRNRAAFYLFKCFAPLIIKNEISIHDGLISVASGFKRKDFKRYAGLAQLKRHKINWKWSMRYLWIINKQ